MKFLILFAQVHEEFRKRELESLAELFQIDVDLSNYSSASPFMTVELKDDTEAAALISRSFLVRAIYRLLASGANYEEVHQQNRLNNFVDSRDKAMRFEFETFGGTRGRNSQVEIIRQFDYMELNGPVDIENPEIRFTIAEEYNRGELEPKRIWFATFVAQSSRFANELYSLKRRNYIGTTSFDAQLAFVTCNFAQVRPYDLVYDPFAGTGSFTVAAAYLGCLVIGADIDIRAIRGQHLNHAQYGTEKEFCDVLSMDFTHNALRPSLRYDAIICDPPYGVREGLRVCGASNPEKYAGNENVMIDNTPAYLRRDYVAPKKPYEFSTLLADLLNFASERLREGARLSFWMPFYVDSTPQFPLHCDLELESTCSQSFNKWKRWLLTYKRRPFNETGEMKPANFDDQFRQRYFNGFGISHR